jgi:hypothetical protein
MDEIIALGDDTVSALDLLQGAVTQVCPGSLIVFLIS